MLYNTLHNRWLRILMGVVGCFISALSLNVFIVPQGLYTGGLLGLCQVIRTPALHPFRHRWRQLRPGR